MQDTRAQLTIERLSTLSPPAKELIAALDADLDARYPNDSTNQFGLDPGEVASGRTSFLIARHDGQAIGCCALRRLEDGTGEIKRLYVRAEHRGKGTARALLASIEAEARALGMKRLLLETGFRQPEAIGLYQRFGYTRIPPFGQYVESPLSLCMGKDLGPPHG